MKSIGIIVSIIGLIIIPVIIILKEKAPDIRYTLSNPITIGLDKGGKNWQQIVVRNRGNIEAHKISIKIKEIISNHEIIKNSESDKPIFFNRSHVFELVYPTLPPNGSFTLTVSTLSKIIEKHKIEVSHSKGLGIEAFEKDNSFTNYFVAILVFAIIVYVILIIINQYEWNLEHNSKYNPLDGVLRKRKPFYIREQIWLDARKNSIGSIFEETEKHKEITITRSYGILNEEQHSYLTREEWEKIQERAISQFEENISYKIMRLYSIKDLLPLINIQPPKYLPEHIWQKINEKINQAYLEKRKEKITFAKLESLRSIIKEKRPEKIQKETWDELQNMVEEKYVKIIEMGIYTTDAPNEYLGENDLTIISKKQLSLLKDKVYERRIKFFPNMRLPEHAKEFIGTPKPEWMKDEDYIEYKKISEKTLEYGEKLEEYKVKISSLDEEKEEIMKMRNELSEKMTKVTLQLDVINQILSDPTSLDRIEDYNNTFATGNYENLKKIASLIAKSETDTN